MNPMTSEYVYSYNRDLSDSVRCEDGGMVAVSPGKDMYFCKDAVKGESFRSGVYHLKVPERRKAPALKVTETGPDFIMVDQEEGMEYTCDGGKNWYLYGEFYNLEPDTEYNIGGRFYSTDSEFASETGVVTVRTEEGSAEKRPPADDGWNYNYATCVWTYGAGGTALAGWQWIDGNWYYFYGSGNMVRAGWVPFGIYWYYFYGSGNMAYSTWIGPYWLGANGAMW